MAVTFNMRTTFSQFEKMITFMEENGDLSKPGQGVALINSLKCWGRLTDILNSEGQRKPMEKWRKVWSDLKNNTKRKALKLQRAANANGTANSTQLKAKLTDIECRVLNIIGLPTNEGEEGDTEAVSQTASSSPPVDRPIKQSPHSPAPECPSPTYVAAITNRTISGPYITVIPTSAAGDEDEQNYPEPESPAYTPPTPRPDPPCPSTSYTAPNNNWENSEASDADIPQEQDHNENSSRPRLKSQSRRTLKKTSIDKVAQLFLQSDDEWKRFLKEKYLKEIELEKERLRIREEELRIQSNWQEICIKALDVLDDMINKK